jgi:hypothetical protein
MKYIIYYFNIILFRLYHVIQTCYCWKGPSMIIAFAVIFHWHLFTISWLIVIFTYQLISNTRVQSPTFDSSRNIVKLLFRYSETKSYFQLHCITVNSHNISEKKRVVDALQYTTEKIVSYHLHTTIYRVGYIVSKYILLAKARMNNHLVVDIHQT